MVVSVRYACDGQNKMCTAVEFKPLGAKPSFWIQVKNGVQYCLCGDCQSKMKIEYYRRTQATANSHSYTYVFLVRYSWSRRDSFS